MVSGWFVFAVVACIVVCSGFVIAISLMKAAWAQRERESLTSNDLRALEESAVLLVEQIKSEAEAAINEMDKRRKALSKLIKDADERLKALAEAPAQHKPEQVERDEEPPLAYGATRILELAEAGMEASEIAKSTGIDCAEVNLVLSLNRSIAA